MATLTDSKALARATVKGLWIAIPTPFTPDGEALDEDALAQSVEHYVAALQVDGIFCGGVMGAFSAHAGELGAARQVSATLEPHRDAFVKWLRKPRTDHGVVPIAQLKAWLGLLGLPHGPVRAPLAPLPDAEHAELRRDLEALNLL